MKFNIKINSSILLFWVLIFIVLFYGCDLLGTSKVSEKQWGIKSDSTWADFSRVVIVFTAENGNYADTAFDGKWSADEDAGRFKPKNWNEGEPLVTRVDGYLDERLVLRTENLFAENEVKKTDTLVYPLLDLTLSVGADTTLTQGNHSLWVTAQLSEKGAVTALHYDLDGDGKEDGVERGFWTGPKIVWKLDSLPFPKLGIQRATFQVECGGHSTFQAMRKITVTLPPLPNLLKSFNLVGSPTQTMVGDNSRYYVRLPYDSSRVTLQIQPNDSLVTLSYRSAKQSLGPDIHWDLEVGANVAFIEAMRLGESKQFDTLIVIRSNQKASAEATLKSFEVDGNEFKLGDGITQYQIVYPNEIDHSTIKAYATFPGASVLKDGNQLMDEKTEIELKLSVGENLFKVTVVSEDGLSEKPYELHIKRSPSPQTSLKILNIISGSLVQSLKKVDELGEINYSVSIPAEISEFKVKAIAQISGSSIKVNEKSLDSEGVSGPYPIGEGNTLTLVVGVTSTDKSVQNYVLKISRPRRTPTLSALVVTGNGDTVKWDKKFIPDTLNYSATVASSTQEIEIKSTPSDSSFSITLDSVGVDSSSTFKGIPLNFGPNLFRLVVKNSALESATYTLSITRPKSSVKFFKAIEVKGVSIGPTLDTAVKNYQAVLPYGTNQAEVKISLLDTTAHMTLDDKPLADKAITTAVIPEGGAKTYRIKVTAQDGSTKDFTLKVYAAASSKPKYAALISGTPQNPSPLANGDYFSSSGSIAASRLSLGLYTVTFAGMNGNGYEGGNFIVTPIGNDSSVCTIRDTKGLGSDLTAKIACYGINDSLAVDTRFSVLLNWPRDSSTGANGFARTNNNEGKGAVYEPEEQYAWNSSGLGQDAQWIGKVVDTVISGATVTMRQGIYLHRFKGLSKSILPAVLFTSWDHWDTTKPYQAGRPAKRLVLESIKNDKGDLALVVDSYGSLGTLSTGKFYVYVAYPEPEGGRRGGYALVTGLASPVVEPKQAWNSAGQAPVVNRTGVGRYQVTFPGLTASGSFLGNAQISMFGNTSSVCKISENGYATDGTGTTVSVSCWDRTGRLSDNSFLVYVIF